MFHRHPQPTMQNPQPYTEEMWKKMKLQYKYNKVLFALLEKTLNNDFFKEKIHMNMYKDPPSNEFNEVLEEWISRSIDRNPYIGHVFFKSHYRVDPLLELNSLKDIVDDFSRNVDFLSSKYGKIFVVFSTTIFLTEDPYVYPQTNWKSVLELVIHEGLLQSNCMYLRPKVFSIWS